MAKINPEIHRLQRLNDLLEGELKRLRTDPGDLPVHGCSDGSCVVAHPGGQHTNGGCRCDQRALRHAMHYWRRMAQFRQVTIQDQRNEIARLESEVGELGNRIYALGGDTSDPWR